MNDPSGKEFVVPLNAQAEKLVADARARLAAGRIPNDPEKNLEEIWKGICPVDFRDLDLQKLPCSKDVYDRVMAWDGTRGLLLHGVTRKGKTRLAWQALKQFHKIGRTIKTFDAIDFGISASGAYRDGTERDFFSSILRPDIIFLDDIGKAKLTARVAEALFGLVDKRMARRKYCVFTLNFTSETFIQRFEDGELGKALLERIRETCLCVHVV